MSRCVPRASGPGAEGGGVLRKPWLELAGATDVTYSVFPRFSVVNMSGKRLITFFSKLLLFTLAVATAALNAA